MKQLIVPLLFLAITFAGLAFALFKTRHLRKPHPPRKHSPFSRKAQSAVSLVHLAADRHMWVSLQVKNSQSVGKHTADRLVLQAKEKLDLAQANLANDELDAATTLANDVLTLLEQAEEKIS